MTAVISVFIKKKKQTHPKLVNFGAAVLILKMEEDMQHFWRVMLYHFKKGKNVTEMQKKDLCSEWRRCCNCSNVSKVVLEVFYYY